MKKIWIKEVWMREILYGGLDEGRLHEECLDVLTVALMT